MTVKLPVEPSMELTLNDTDSPSLADTVAPEGVILRLIGIEVVIVTLPRALIGVTVMMPEPLRLIVIDCVTPSVQGFTPAPGLGVGGSACELSDELGFGDGDPTGDASEFTELCELLDCEPDGDVDGDAEGNAEGDTEGDAEGDTEGDPVGDAAGDALGDTCGEGLGDIVGLADGDGVGDGFPLGCGGNGGMDGATAGPGLAARDPGWLTLLAAAPFPLSRPTIATIEPSATMPATIAK